MKKIILAFSCLLSVIVHVYGQSGISQRKYFVQKMIQIANPVLVNLSQNTLKQNMPVESNHGRQGVYRKTNLQVL